MRKKIAVFVNGYGMEALNATLKGLSQSESYSGYDFFIFVSYASYDTPDNYNKGELNIYGLPQLKDYDGAIVFTNALNSVETGISIVKRAVKAGIPVISIGINVPGSISFDIDNITGMRELVEHLIEEHGVKRAAFIGGKIDHPESVLRYETVKKVFEEHGLVLDERDVYYGNWGNVLSAEAANKIASDPRGLPDAIIAANDIMALACSTELKRLGYNLPKDVIVTGYDFIYKGQAFYPVLTTVTSDYEGIGSTIIKVFDNVFEGKEVPKSILMKSKPVIGESCRCHADAEFDIKRREFGSNTYSEYLDRTYLEASERTLTNIITDSPDYESLRKNLMAHYESQLDLVGNDFFIIIHNLYMSDIMASEEDVHENGITGAVSPIVAIKDGKVCDNISADRHSVVPGYDPESKNNHIYFLMPLHTGRFNYGYMVTSGDARIMLEYLDLNAYLEKLMLALRIQRSNIQLRIFNDSLRKISEIDTMTGLYNRFGYENKAIPIYEDSVRGNTLLMVMFIDINLMKRINDIFGHMNGDAAIRITASAIKSNLKNDMIGVRFGGDEFLVIGSVNSPEEADSLKQAIHGNIDKVNRDGIWPFRLSISSGYILSDKETKKPLSEYIKDADNLMYETKKKLHAEQGDHR
ncbi:MAG: diguanylate cyclase [Ruminococcaceae bacterium]|nr:diguanylate cyclase [Oscillospiraceae bacterium]